MTAVATAPVPDAIVHVVEEILDHSRAYGTFDPGELLMEGYSALFRRWECTSDKCPATPPEIAVWATFEARATEIDEAVDHVIRDTLKSILADVSAAHPDAPRVAKGGAS